MVFYSVFLRVVVSIIYGCSLIIVISSTSTSIAAPLTGVFRLASGGGHTCSLDINLVVRCWGQNDFGQLGINNTVNRSAPQTVNGFDDEILAISAGGIHTCATTSNNQDLYCWGGNNQGQLGDGTTTKQLSPKLITAAGIVNTAATGVFHTCVLDSNFEVKCWGRNNEGQLGNGTNTDSSTPVSVSGLGQVSEIYAGGYHTCAKTLASGVKCWGANDKGQLGNGNMQNSNTPVDVLNLSGNVNEVSAGLIHTCALISNGTVDCWGIFPSTTASSIPGFTNISSLSAGAYHQCVINNNGRAQCMGWNGRGQIGDGTTVNKNTPTTVTGLDSGVNEISAGGAHTCAAINGDLEVKCWGSNEFGQLAVDGGGL